jgi:hypothetical protein
MIYGAILNVTVSCYFGPSLLKLWIEFSSVREKEDISLWGPRELRENFAKQAVL